ncbi:aldolase/citrate lyase family protein [Shewanella algae]|uniref:aldolase/citrate lyase family protein n=1 Tax=Shewanella algae TaxID=38313 RepID=UPI000BB5FDC0|nr:aldolase/citrate lyase family protein [Shewanella algae]PBQ28621.1 hypothetical protein AYI97_06190 [Shewanella algae]
MELMLITNDPEYATYAEHAGVDIIFIDLEVEGKLERQGHLNTVISYHTVDDIPKVKAVLNKAKLLVRVNPYNEKSKGEINKAIEYGADIIMLPMFKSEHEVKEVHKIIGNRAEFIPLLETKSALDNIEKIIKLGLFKKIHIGLNDLHLDLKLDHMLDLLDNGIIDDLVLKLNSYGIDYGIGGVAAMDKGDVPGNIVLRKYLALESKRVILSRAFHGNYNSDLNFEVQQLRCQILKFLSV